jgi:hypothetical protein
MAEIFTDEGLDYALGVLFKAGTVDTTLYIGLFTSQTASTVPARTATGGASPSGWTEAAYTSYARVAISTGGWGAASTNGSGRKIAGAQATFPTVGASGATVNGYFIATNSASGAGDTTICFANFDSAIARVLVTNDVIKVTPSVQFDG